MAKLQALKAIEALSPDKLAEALINNGYPQCRQLILDKGINGATFMNLTELRLKQYQIYLKPSDIHRLWSLILRTKEHPEDFVLPNTDSRPVKKPPPPKPVRPQKNRTSITQALRDRITHQAICVQESSDEEMPDHPESEWSDDEKMPNETPNESEEPKEKKEEEEKIKVNGEDNKSFKENRERIRKLFQERSNPEVEVEQTKKAPPPPVPSKTKEPIYVNIQEMKEEDEQNMLPTPPKLDSIPKPPRPNKPDKKTSITDGTLNKIDKMPPKQDTVPRKHEMLSKQIIPPPKLDIMSPNPNKMQPQLDEMPPKPDKMPPKPDRMPPKPDRMPPKPDRLPPKPEKMPPKPDKMPPKPEEMPPKQDKIPFQSDKVPPKPFRIGDISSNAQTLPQVSKVSPENNKKFGTLRIPPNLNKILLAVSQTNNNKTVEPELPRPLKPLQKQNSYDDDMPYVYDEIPDIDTPPPSPPPNFPQQKPEKMSKQPPPPPPITVGSRMPPPPPSPGFRPPPLPKQVVLAPSLSKQDASTLQLSPTTKDDAAVLRKSPSPKPPLQKQDEPSALRLPPPPPELLRPPPIPPTPQRQVIKAEVEDNYEEPPAIRLNGNGNLPPPLPRRPLNPRNSNDDEDDEGYLINSDFMSSKESLNSNQDRPLPPVPSEDGAGAVTAGPLERNMYYRDLERKGAEKLLAFQPVGAFLLRPSKTYFATLVIKSRQRTCNVPIVRDGSQYYLLMDANFLDQALMFSSLDNLINHYTVHTVPLKDNSLCLRKNYNLPK